MGLDEFPHFFLLYPQLVVTVTEHYPIFQVKSGLDLISLSRSAGSQRVNFYFFFQQNASVVVVVVVSSMAVMRIL